MWSSFLCSFLSKLLKRSQVWRMVSPHCNFQLFPWMFNRRLRSGLMEGHLRVVQCLFSSYSWVLLAFCFGSLSCFRTHNLQLGLSFLTLHVHSRYTRCPLLKLTEGNHQVYLTPKEFGVCQHAFWLIPVSHFCIFPSVAEPTWFFFHGARYCLTCKGWCDQIGTWFWMVFLTLLLPSTLSFLWTWVVILLPYTSWKVGLYFVRKLATVVTGTQNLWR